jgi:hypothetical protein
MESRVKVLLRDLRRSASSPVFHRYFESRMKVVLLHEREVDSYIEKVIN